MPAMVHANEMVLPSPISETIQRMTADGSGGGGETHLHFNISAMDGASVRDMLLNERGTIAEAFGRAVRDAHPAAAAIMHGAR